MTRRCLACTCKHPPSPYYPTEHLEMLREALCRIEKAIGGQGLDDEFLLLQEAANVALGNTLFEGMIYQLSRVYAEGREAREELEKLKKERDG